MHNYLSVRILEPFGINFLLLFSLIQLITWWYCIMYENWCCLVNLDHSYLCSILRIINRFYQTHLSLDKNDSNIPLNTDQRVFCYVWKFHSIHVIFWKAHYMNSVYPQLKLSGLNYIWNISKLVYPTKVDIFSMSSSNLSNHVEYWVIYHPYL